jgi:hypothetical protein
MRILYVLLICWLIGFAASAMVWAEGGTEFPGTVLTVDQATGKFSVKKQSGGTRFTFTANEKTKYQGSVTSLKDLKKDDKVVVVYEVHGPQYLALRITKQP